MRVYSRHPSHPCDPGRPYPELLLTRDHVVFVCSGIIKSSAAVAVETTKTFSLYLLWIKIEPKQQATV